jgi:hypothetical protein
MNKHPLPWQSRPSINAPQLCHLFDAAGDVVAVGLTDEEADTIIAAVNPTAKLVEAAEAILENAPTGDYADMTNVPEAVQRANALRTALAEYRSACP